MNVEIGSVYRNSTGNLLLLVIARSALFARCVVIWSNVDVTTGFRSGDVDNWNAKLIEECWERVS